MTCQTYPPSPYEVCGAIRDKYNQLGGPSSFLLYPTSNEMTNPDGYGKRSTFLNGPIYWSPSGGAHPVVNHFFACWQRNGWEAGPLGYPTSDEIVNPDPVAPIGRRQYFQGGTIYWKLNEAYYVTGAIRDKWGENGWEQGWLGYPISDETKLPDGQGRMNRFDHGVIYWHPATSAFPVSGRILDTWAAAGYERSAYGYPVGAQSSPDGDVTLEQRFQHGVISVPGPKVVTLSEYMSESTPEQVLADARTAAQTAAKPLTDAVDGALREAGSNSNITSGDSEGFVPIPPARRAGDLFYSDAASSLADAGSGSGSVPGSGFVKYEHGHNGIYINTVDTVQALDEARGVQRVLGNDTTVHTVRNPVLMQVNTDDGMRGRAAQYAGTKVGSGYDGDFAFNRRRWKDGEAGTYNCSQLVWAAYMNASGGAIDLDVDDGWGVWPRDIRDSNWVTHYT